MKGIANLLAAKGRGADSTLVHMAPQEVRALQGIAQLHGGSLTINPATGLPEAGFLTNVLPVLAGVASEFFFPGNPWGAAAIGGATGLATTGKLSGAVTGALGGVGGASLAGLAGIGGAGAGSSLYAGDQMALGGAQAANMGLDTAGMSAGDQMALGAAQAAAAGGDYASAIPGMATTPGAPNLQMPPTDITTPIGQQQLGGVESGYGAASPLQGPTAPPAGLPAIAPPGDTGAAINTAVQGMRAPDAGAGISGLPSWLQNQWNTNPMFQGSTYMKDNKLQLPGMMALLGGSSALNQMATARANAASQKARSQFYNSYLSNHYAQGGIASMYPNRPPTREVIDTGIEPQVDPFTGQLTAARGGMLRGPGDGMSDSIPATIEGKQPAALADSEFVIPADIVSSLGNGSSDAGAKHLYSMMDRVRRAKTGRAVQPKAIKAGKFLPA